MLRARHASVLAVMFVSRGVEPAPDFTSALNDAGCSLNASNTCTGIVFPLRGLVGTLPTELGMMTAVTRLGIASNSISGTLPTELALMTQLTGIGVDTNALSGPLPTEFGLFTGLTLLYVNANQLNGTVPSQLMNLRRAVQMNLCRNFLFGSLPSEIGLLSTSLTYFHVAYNALTSTIPTELGRASRLFKFGFNNNDFSGTLPTELGLLTAVGSFVYFNNNELSGTIPTEIGRLTGVAKLDMSANMLAGTVPTELGRLSRLFELALASNRLSGSLPTELAALTGVSRLTLDAKHGLCENSTELRSLLLLSPLPSCWEVRPLPPPSPSPPSPPPRLTSTSASSSSPASSSPSASSVVAGGLSAESRQVLGSVLGCGLALLCALGVLGSLWRRRRARAVEEMLDKALLANSVFGFPLHCVAFSRFAEMGRLRPFEEVRDAQQHKVLDLVEDAHAFFQADTGRHLIFVSHQWLGLQAPDERNVQFPVMLAALEHVLRANEWLGEDVFIWCDFCSIPQRHSPSQQAAVSSLALYANSAHAFVIAAPEATHSDTGARVSSASYQMRTWCRAEQFCYAVRHGMSNMWLATSQHSAPLPVDEEWLYDGLLVFEGQLTCCELLHCANGVQRAVCDRQSLVLPILGLWAELFSLQCAVRAATSTGGAGGRGRGAGGRSRPYVQRFEGEGRREGGAPRSLSEEERRMSVNVGHFMRWLDPARKARMFPRDFQFVSARQRGSRSQRRELFGSLIERMERRIERRLQSMGAGEFGQALHEHLKNTGHSTGVLSNTMPQASQWDSRTTTLATASSRATALSGAESVRASEDQSPTRETTDSRPRVGVWTRSRPPKVEPMIPES